MLHAWQLWNPLLIAPLQFVEIFENHVCCLWNIIVKLMKIFILKSDCYIDMSGILQMNKILVLTTFYALSLYVHTLTFVFKCA